MSGESSTSDKAEAVPGGRAERPTEIPPRGWLQVAKRGWQEASADQVPLLAAGVAFFGFLALFPAMVAFTLVWGLLADPATVTEQTRTLTESLPPEARTLLAEAAANGLKVIVYSYFRDVLGWAGTVAAAVTHFVHRLAQNRRI